MSEVGDGEGHQVAFQGSMNGLRTGPGAIRLGATTNGGDEATGGD